MMHITLITIFWLYLAFQMKHFLCDYPLQTPYMLGKFKEKGWVFPLTLHCLVHAIGTMAIQSYWFFFVMHGRPRMRWVIAMWAFDFVIHFVMDRVKASPKLMGRWKAMSANEMWVAMSYAPYCRKEFESQLRANTLFWWALGLDQMVHHLTDFVILLALVFLAVS